VRKRNHSHSVLIREMALQVIDLIAFSVHPTFLKSLGSNIVPVQVRLSALTQQVAVTFFSVLSSRCHYRQVIEQERTGGVS